MPSATEVIRETVQERLKAQFITTDYDRNGKLVDLLGPH